MFSVFQCSQKRNTVSRPYTWMDHLRITLCLEPHGHEYQQERLVTRVTIHSYAVLAFFACAFFQAAFFFKLTVPQYYAGIEDLDGLIDKGLPIRMNSLYTFLLKTYPDKEVALARLGSPNVPSNFEEALKLVVAGKAALLKGWHETVFAQKVW